jgi:two-component system LytT family response regulator
MINALLVDDEQMAINALKGLLEEQFPEINIIGECNNVPEAVRFIQKNQPHVVFLDVEMPEYNGFDLLDFFRADELNFQIIFVTAYSQYSLQAFEISAVDYLLKPVRAEHLARAIKKIKTQDKSESNLSYVTLKENLQEEKEGNQKIILHTTESVFILKLADIYYLEAQGSYTKFVTQTHKDLLISKKISDFSYLEQSPLFFRSHRSYIVNLRRLLRIDKRESMLDIENGQSIYLAQDKKKMLLEKLGSFS